MAECRQLIVHRLLLKGVYNYHKSSRADGMSENRTVDETCSFTLLARFFMRMSAEHVGLILIVLSFSVCSCSRQSPEDKEFYNRVSALGYPFSVSLSNDTVHMKYMWDREFCDYAIAVHPYIEEDVMELGPEIPDLPKLRRGVSFALTAPEINTKVWKLGFDVMFYPNTSDLPTYGWKCRHGKVTEFILGKNE